MDIAAKNGRKHTGGTVLRKLCALLLSALLLVVFAGCEPTDATPATQQDRGMQGLVIVVDAGHGGMDKGARSASGVREDQLNLAVAKYLEQELAAAGVTVVMTRTGDGVDYSGEGSTKKQKDMDSRAKLIRGSAAAAVISIHMNKYPQAQYRGAQTFYWNDSAEGQKMSKSIQDALIAGLPGGNTRQIKPGDYFILHVTDAPAALVECGFLSNAQEERSLQDPAYQQQVAKCIAQGVIAYFQSR